MIRAIQKSDSKNRFAIIAILLLFVGTLFIATSVFAYRPASPEELQQVKELEFKNLFFKLSSGGLSGNLGSSLLLFFTLIFPSFIALIVSLRYQFPLLKVLQFPALICMGFGLVVLFFQPQRWLSGDWAAQYVSFSFFVGLVFGLASVFLMRTIATLSALWCAGSLAIGFLFYTIISLL